MPIYNKMDFLSWYENIPELYLYIFILVLYLLVYVILINIFLVKISEHILTKLMY